MNVQGFFSQGKFLTQPLLLSPMPKLWHQLCLNAQCSVIRQRGILLILLWFLRW